MSTPPRRITDLPTELLTEILRTIADVPSLSRASRVCRNWHEIATPLLYTAPEFSSGKSFEKFLEAVSGNDKLGKKVRDVNLLSTPQHWEFFTTKEATALCTACPEIIYLDLEGCSALRDAGVSAIVENCKNLQSLSLSFCDKITDDGVLPIATHCPNLRALELKGLPYVSDRSIQEVAIQCPLLESVNLAGTRVTDPAVICLIRKATNLTFLDLSSCYNMMFIDNIIAELKPDKLEIVTDSMPKGAAGWESDWDESELTDSDDEDGQGWMAVGPGGMSIAMSLDI